MCELKQQNAKKTSMSSFSISKLITITKISSKQVTINLITKFDLPNWVSLAFLQVPRADSKYQVRPSEFCVSLLAPIVKLSRVLLKIDRRRPLPCIPTTNQNT